MVPHLLLVHQLQQVALLLNLNRLGMEQPAYLILQKLLIISLLLTIINNLKTIVLFLL